MVSDVVFFGKKGDLEMDQLGNILLGLVLLIVLIYIVTIVIKGEFGNQGDKIVDALNFF